MVHLYPLTILLLLSVPALAQPHAHPPPGNPQRTPIHYPNANQFEHLSMQDGLSNNSITAIIQDRAGFMWFGTKQGLNKYDGHTFTLFQPDPKQPDRSFRDSYIRGLCEGSSDQLWVATEGGGLHEVNQQTGVVIAHPIPPTQNNPWNHQHSVYKDSQNRIWVSTSAGLARYEPARHQFTLYPSPETNVPVVSVLEDRQHRFWVATVRGLYHLNVTTGRFTQVPVRAQTGTQPYVASIYLDKQDRLWLGAAAAGFRLLRLDLRQQPWRLEGYKPGDQLNPFVWRNTMHQDALGILWVGTTNGLYAIDPVGDKVVTYQTDPNRPKGIASSNASAVYHDRQGMLWVGTDNGIDRQAMETKPFRVYPDRLNAPLPAGSANKVSAAYQDRMGQLWYSNTETVYRQPPNQSPRIRVPPEKLGSVGNHKNAVYAIFPDSSTGIWFGTATGLYHLDLASGQYTNYPSRIPVQFIDMYRIPAGKLWIGGKGGIASFNRQTHQYTYYTDKRGASAGSMPAMDVYGLMVNWSGEVWVLLHRQGIWRLQPDSAKTRHYRAGSSGHLSSNEVLSIHEDADNIIWIGTQSGELNRFDWRSGLFSVIPPQQGSAGYSLVGITSDESGCLWLSTDKGLLRFDPRTRTTHTYGVTDGLIRSDARHYGVYRLPGQLMFGTENGIVQFNPSRLLDDTRPFPVYITGLTVLDKFHALTDSVVRIHHDESRVTFGFAALAYEHPEQNQYAYQLSGLDQDWVQNGNRHSVNYNSLLPGSYTFRVKAANSNGFWTKNIASVRVIVEPPWWATWWAYVFYAVLAGGAIWTYIRFYTNRIKQRQELLLNRQQAEQLRAVDELKTRFFANITHEFRTPLSLIIAPVDKLLDEGRFDRPMLTTVQRNAGRLLRLINQLLDISKLEGNYMTVALVQGNVPDFVKQLVETFGRAAVHKAITLRCDMTSVPTQDYVFDADKWEKILTNLLSNALKFTGAGGTVTVTGMSVPVADGLAGVEFRVSDSGIGIAPDKLAHIFDRFYQADTSSTRAYEGTGIGLALVKELVALLGGTITVVSEPGAGSSFVLTLPVVLAAATSHVPRLEPVEAAARRPNRLDPETLATTRKNEHVIDGQSLPCVLVVEDNDELREFLVAELAGTYHVLQAADGAAGWAIVQAELPDMVLTDLMMPRMDGYELTRCIKTTPDTDHIAVVMLTAKSAQQSRLNGLQQGADEYLAKPFNVDELQLRLRNLITRQQKLGEHYRQQLTLRQPTPANVPPDPFLLRIYSLLDSHLSDPSISVDWLADQLAMTRKTLYRKVNTLIQLPPVDLIRQYRLRKAADLLRAGHTVAETADLAGFSTPSHFSLVFKEFYQQTPSEYMSSQIKNA